MGLARTISLELLGCAGRIASLSPLGEVRTAEASCASAAIELSGRSASCPRELCLGGLNSAEEAVIHDSCRHRWTRVELSRANCAHDFGTAHDLGRSKPDEIEGQHQGDLQ